MKRNFIARFIKMIPGAIGTYVFWLRCKGYVCNVGIINWWKLRHAFRHAEGEMQVHIKGLPHAVIIRKETSDFAAFEQVFVFETYKVKLPRGAGLIIDGGANAGFASLYFHLKYPEKKIVAVEPEPSNCELMRRNFAGYAGIQQVEAALWSHNTSLSILNPDAMKWAYRMEASVEDSQQKIRAVTPGELLADSGYDKIDLLKLDIEGAEKELFSSGYENWIAFTNCIVIEFHDRFKPGCSQAFHRVVDPLVASKRRKGESEIYFLRT